MKIHKDFIRKMKEDEGTIGFGSRKKPIIMEVVGEDGQKVSEYVDKGDKKPYEMVLEESVTMNWKGDSY